MKPDRNNYELWIIDYLDGRLDKDQKDNFMKFLEKNPDIKEELTILADFKIHPLNIHYQRKNSLRKTAAEIPENQFELLCVKALENDLTGEQAAEISQIISGNPEMLEKYNLIQNLKLKPPAIEFKHKNRLRKKSPAEKITSISVSLLGVAASITLLVLFLPFKKQVTSTQISDVSQSEIHVSLNDSLIINNISAGITPFTATVSGEKNPVSEKTSYLIQIAEHKKFTENLKIEKRERLPSNEASVALISFKPGLPSINTGKTLKLKPSTINFSISENFTTNNERHNIKWHFANLVRQKILKTSKNPDETLKAYEIAEAGIAGLNHVLGWQMALNEFTDENGDLIALNFNSKLLKFNIPAKKNEQGQ